MIIDQDDDLHGFARTNHRGVGWREMLVSDDGDEPVILLHELPSITPEVLYLARVIVAAGFKIYLPSFIGEPGKKPRSWDSAKAFGRACVSAEIAAVTKGEETRGAVSGLRALARELSTQHGGKSVGVIGLCLTGGFALATATEPVVAGSVACEPSLPLLSVGGRKRMVDISPADQPVLAARMAAGELAAMLLRFEGDTLSPCERLGRVREIFGPALVSHCIPDGAADPARTGFPEHHCVVTNHLVEAPESQTLAARDEIIAFLNWRLRGGAAPAKSAKLRDCLKDGCARGVRLPTPA